MYKLRLGCLLCAVYRDSGLEEMAHDVTVEATLQVKGVGSSTKAVFVILKEVAGVPEV